jgi:hypothetical protein
MALAMAMAMAMASHPPGYVVMLKERGVLVIHASFQRQMVLDGHV